MRTYAEVERDARDTPAFSDGTMGYGWMANWCARCTNDDMEKRDPSGLLGCPIIAVTMVGKTPIEFLAQTERDDILGNYTCIEFRDKDNPGPGEPQPLPDPPGQELLLPREPFEAARMLVQPQGVEVSA